MMRTDWKPPLPIRSPIRLRSRRILQPNSDPVQVKTPPGPGTGTGTQMKTKSTCKTYSWDFEVSPLYHHHTSMACEFKALAKMVNEHNNSGFVNANNSRSMFERGRFYDEYSARRNERLRRKKILDEDNNKTPPHKLGVRIAESAKTKRTKTISRSSSSSTATRLQEPPRYLLRSTTKTKPNKPSLPLASTKSRTGATTIYKF